MIENESTLPPASTALDLVILHWISTIAGHTPTKEAIARGAKIIRPDGNWPRPWNSFQYLLWDQKSPVDPEVGEISVIAFVPVTHGIFSRMLRWDNIPPAIIAAVIGGGLYPPKPPP